MQKTFEVYLKDLMPKISWSSAKAVVDLTEEGGTVPFIARYRKEKTGNLDEVQIRDILDAQTDYNDILKRKEFVLKEIQEQGNLTDILKTRIEGSWALSEIEELYRPYKKKKKTKATLAREAGLEPLADWIWSLGQGEDHKGTTLEVKAKEFVNAEKKFVTYEEILRGATNILIEKVYNDSDLRALVRKELSENGKMTSKPGKKVKAHSKYSMYFEHSEPVKNLLLKKNSHRYLAMKRGWGEGELAVTLEADEEMLLNRFQDFACPNKDSISKNFLDLAAKSALTVHTIPSITNEIHRELKDAADLFAIEVFANNVKQVLLSSPYGPRCVLGVDPGLRTGCKLALIDQKGQFISHTVLHVQGEKAMEKAKTLFTEVFKQIEIEAIAVGNGTGGREAELFLRKVLKELGKAVTVILVNESGASIYSASEIAREEFPDLDLTVRGAISIARRLQDPLAELVKLEPKSIGVGQYQHDVAQTTLKKRLDAVVESCVNNVGVDVNTASAKLLQYVSGIGPAVAKNIVQFRQEKGLFKNRNELSQVSSFSTKTFEQAAGFLRIRGGEFVLDSTGVHPESYAAVRDMAGELKMSVTDLMGSGADKLETVKEKWGKLLGEYTFKDVCDELKKPGRDPRAEFKVFEFRDDIFELKDVKADMICNGVVTNVTNFGAFVDIGVHQDGLVHISELGQDFVDDPQKVVSPGDQIQVKIKAVDLEKKQIQLTMRMTDATAVKRPARKASAKKRTEYKGKAAGGKPGKGKERGKNQRNNNRNDKPRRPSSPFNNPFAALQGLDKD